MERGQSSNQEFKYKYSRRAKSGRRGVFFEDLNEAVKVEEASNPINPQRGPKRECMPMANVVRIMHQVLPCEAKIDDGAKETMQECVSQFISHITRKANDRCHQDYRRTVTPEDVLGAMGSLGLDNYVETLTLYLNRYRANGPMQQRVPPNIVQRPLAQPPLLPPAPPPPEMTIAYVPQPPPSNHADQQLPLPFIDYFGVNKGGCGQGSKDMDDFDPFQ